MGMALLVEILFVVFWILAFVFHPWPNAPWSQNAPWAPHLLYMLLFALLGVAVFAYRM